MNIPDEVQHAALTAFEEALDATGSVGPSVTATWQVIAEWARKEALREALVSVAALDPNPHSYYGIADWVIGKNAAVTAIKALAEGDI